MHTFLGSLVRSRCGEGGSLQTNNTGMCSQRLSHTGPAPAHGAFALPVHTAQALGCSAGNRPRPALGCMHFPGLSRSGSGTWVVLRGADLVGPAFCALPRSEQLRLLSRCSTSDLLRRMLTVQTPKKSLLAKKPAFSFVDNVSGAAIAPFQFWLPVTRGGQSAAGYLCTVLCSVHGPGGVLG